jgi:hypothetical protein
LQKASPLTTPPYSNGFLILRKLRYASCVIPQARHDGKARFLQIEEISCPERAQDTAGGSPTHHHPPFPSTTSVGACASHFLAPKLRVWERTLHGEALLRGRGWYFVQDWNQPPLATERSSPTKGCVTKPSAS